MFRNAELNKIVEETHVVKEQFLSDFADLGLGILALPTMHDDGLAFESRRAAVEFEDQLGAKEQQIRTKLCIGLKVKIEHELRI